VAENCFRTVSLFVSANSYTSHITIVMFRGELMKTWKIIAIATCSLIAVALLIVSAFAYMGGQGFYMPYGTNTATTSPYGTYPNGMMGGGMMG
jgi:hypothetical protein